MKLFFHMKFILLAVCLAYHLTLKKKVVCPPETSITLPDYMASHPRRQYSSK
jgi:hypothetical protein